MSDSLKKYGLFLAIILVFVVADQWTKVHASNWLASQYLAFSHPIVLKVEPGQEGKTVKELLSSVLTANSPSEVDQIAFNYTRLTDAEGTASRPAPDLVLKAGQTVEITQRKVVVVPDYFDFQYTRNPGAAFGFLADADSPWRKPFFITVSLVAVGIIVMILRGVAFQQQILLWGLSLIAAGAVGNFIDRVRLGYVIDFIVWKYTDEYRWPTFNIADALICVGVGLMMIEIIRDTLRERREAQAGGMAEAQAGGEADAG